MRLNIRVDDHAVRYTCPSLTSTSYVRTRFCGSQYNNTIGLVFGPTILGMHGKQHHDHRSLISKAFRQSALERWEPAVIDPICDHLVDEIKDDGAADLITAITLEFPTRVTAALLGLPEEDLDLFRRLSFDLISIYVDVEAGLNASVELQTYFQEQVDQRRRKMTNDVIGDLVGAEIDGAHYVNDLARTLAPEQIRVNAIHPTNCAHAGPFSR
jgi:cytochrome P450